MDSRIVRWLYKWLPIIYGCHCRDDRSFHWKGRKFPICARCTGMLVGTILFCCFSFFWFPGFLTCILLLLPLVADGWIQMNTSYESTNIRRFVTGILFGFAFPAVFVHTQIWSYHFGYGLTH